MTQNAMDESRDRIAVIGMSGRFPGARNVNEFWRLLEDGVEAIRFFTPTELDEAGVPEELARNPSYVPANGYLDGVELFDSSFFGMTPREAEITDPQHRLFLECSWHALESAGQVPEHFDGRIGVYAGCGLSTYLLFHLFRNPDLPSSINHLQFLMGNSNDYLPTRVSYKLNLKGPSVNVNSACSSSLVAVHMACQALLDFECDMALAGGAGIQLPQQQGYLYDENSITSPDGHCRAFDARAGGTVSGNGVGVVVLRRLEDALADGDAIRAVILGSAINNDGADKVGYAAPSVEGQASVIAEALSVAGIDPDTIHYIETHGTGTKVGDPIEIEALSRAFGSSTRKNFCALGSAKTNIGHLDEAAGIAGLIKAILAIERAQIPASLHFESPNPEIDFENSPFFVNDRLRSWPSADGPRRAGISSFGIGGTNAHVVLEQAPPLEEPSVTRRFHIVPVSARTESSLELAKELLADHLETNPGLSPAAVASTLQTGRKAFEHRDFVCGRSLVEIVRGLRSRQSRSDSGSRRGGSALAFMFPGQGAQYSSMVAELYETEPFFHEELDRSVDLVRQQTPAEPLSFLSDDEATAAQRLARTGSAQPALFAVELALARLWMHWGLKPDFLIGHSLGEYVAACISGIFSQEEGVRIVLERGRLMQSMPEGAMLALPLSERDISPHLSRQLDLAAVNGPEMCVVSGPGAEIDRLEKRLSDEGVLGRRLATSHAFHSRMMKPMLGEFEEVMRSVSLSAPRIPIVSNTTGRLLSSQQATDPSYWTEHASKPVLFAAGVDLLLGQGCEIFLEVGPSNTLTKIVGRLTNNATVIPSLPHPRERSTDQETLSRAVGRAWTQGVDLSWQALAENDETRPLDLPPYPFAHDRHWVDMPGRQSAMHEPPQHAASEVDLDDWFYQPSWHRDEERPGDTGRPVRCLVFHNDEVLEVRLRDALEHMGTTVYTVRPGDRCEQFEDGRFTIRADVQEDYATLVEQLDDAPDLVLHLWTLPGDSVSGQALDLGFYSLLYLAQSLPRKFVSPCQWLVCSPSCYAVTGMENLAPVHAALSGITAVIPLEFPALVCRHVDLDACDPGVVAVQILREMRTNDSPNLTAWRNGERWIRSWAPLDLPQPARTTAVKAGETYLITGGLGSMGLAFAEYMGGQAPCRIVLTGRSQFPEREQWEALLRMAANRDPNGEDLSPDPDNPTVDFPGASILDQVEGFEREAEPVRDLQSTCQAIRRIGAIEQSGSTVEYIRADAADPDAMNRLRSHIRTGYGAVDGIVHTAGELGQGFLIQKTREAVARTFGPKIHATAALEDLLEEFAPSFLLLCSSMSSIAPIIGQADYASANAFLDAYAQAANGKFDTRVVSITWGFWQELGMIDKARGDLTLQRALAVQIQQSGLGDAGVRAFARILDNPSPAQVVVAPDGIEEKTAMRRMSHPWFDQVVCISEDLVYLQGSVSPDSAWVLDEHEVLGKKILPGTAYLEMARAAAAEGLGSTPAELREVYFLRPLVVERGETRDIRTVLQKQDDGWNFVVLSQNGATERNKWIEHARGEIQEATGTENNLQHVDLEAIRQACDRETSASSLSEREAFQASMSAFGPHWHNLVQAHFGQDQALGEFELHHMFVEELDQLHLHPALLDNATGFLKVKEDEGPALPFSYRSILLYDAVPGHVFSHIRRQGSGNQHTISYDITIADPNGRVIVEIEAYALRLVPREGATSRVFSGDAPENAALALGERGSLSTFLFSPEPRRDPAEDEVEIEIKTTGLNFIEVLYSLGMLPHTTGLRFPYGLECAGIVLRSGSDAGQFRPGDEVVAFANGCFKAFATVPTRVVAHKPEALSMEQAATLPAAYMTAWHALTGAARLVEGERVLVHSAAGGVGLAAVHVARLLGAEVLATAGTEEKRQYLQSVGVLHVADSRSSGFGKLIMEATDGAGVDIVLNSLGEEFASESMSVLARYGRFIELGKRAIFGNGSLDLRPFERQLTFTAVDVGPDLPQFANCWKDLMGHVRAGALPPLPLRVFQANNPAEGYEYMARGQHIGKIVFTFGPAPELLRLTSQPADDGRSFASIVGLETDSSESSVEPGGGFPREEEAEPPSDLATKTEKGVARIWRDLLGISSIQRHDNFFDLNGDSLLAAQVISQVHREFGVKLAFSSIFDAPTVEELALEIDKSRGSAAPPAGLDDLEEGVI